MHVSDDLILGNPLNPEHGDRARRPRPHPPAAVHGAALDGLCECHGLVRVSTTTVGYYPLPPLRRRAWPRAIDPLTARS